MKFNFTFRSEGLWMLAFPLVPGTVVIVLLLVIKMFGIMR